MSTYTVRAVSPDVKSYEGKHGLMNSYKLKFEEGNQDIVVQLSQKATSPAPRMGDRLDGTIDMGAQYGPKFQKDFKQGGGGGGFKGGSAKTADPYAMYVAYAKDVAVAQLGTMKKGDTFDFGAYDKVLDAVAVGGKKLFDSKEGEQKTDNADDSFAKEVKDHFGDGVEALTGEGGGF